MAAMDAPEAPGRAFNVATGRRIGIAELASQLCDLLGSRRSSPRSPASSGPATSATASPTRPWPATCSASRRRTSIEDGLPELVEWVAGQDVSERGDEALERLRRAGLVG